MKIVVKGVMTVEDALASVRHGVDGIWVSNHGARQLDTTPATIEVLNNLPLCVISVFSLFVVQYPIVLFWFILSRIS